MNEKTLRALVEAGAIKKITIIAEGSRFHVDVATLTGSVTATTVKGTIKTWSSVDAAAKWVRSLGLGTVYLNVVRWQPEQKGLKL